MFPYALHALQAWQAWQAFNSVRGKCSLWFLKVANIKR